MDIYQEVKKIINEADGILIGASNGLSIAEGYNLFADDSWFQKNMEDVRNKYGIHCIIQGMAFPYFSQEEKWVYFSRIILLSDAELAELQADFPAVWQEYIEKLSAYMESTGKAYRSHAVTPSFRTVSPPFSNLTPLNVIEEAAQIRLKKSRCFSIMEAWQRQESDRMSAIHEKGGRCH